MSDIERCGRGHVLSGWGDVDSYCTRCHGDLFVLERELDETRQQLGRATGALDEAIKAARLFNRNGMTWMEYDRLLVRLEGVVNHARGQ